MMRFAVLLMQWVQLGMAFHVTQRSVTNPTALRYTSLAPSRVSLVRLENFNMDTTDADVEDYDDRSGILALIENTGESLKPAAERASAKSTFVEGKWPKIRYLAQSCLLFTLFILFRGYRGFFVVLPAVFRHTYRNLQEVIDEDPFEIESSTGSSWLSHHGSPKKRTIGWRTAITLTIVSTIVTLSYVLGGLIRVFGTALRSGGGLTKSFESAAAAQERHEETLFGKMKTRNANGASR